MRAVLATGPGDPQVLYLGDTSRPAPPPGHLLIRYILQYLVILSSGIQQLVMLSSDTCTAAGQPAGHTSIR
jgi:hypothetical protein